MNSSGMKENANPIIYEVKETVRVDTTANTKVGSYSIQSFGGGVDDDDTNNHTSSMEQINTCLAWQHVMEEEQYNLDILKEAGLLSSSKRNHTSLFSTNKKNQFIRQRQRKQCSRDAITVDEVFEMIRHIQDPEHLDLTLEQLNVVNYKHVYVIDNHTDLLHDSSSSINPQTKLPLSRVHIYIT